MTILFYNTGSCTIINLHKRFSFCPFINSRKTSMKHTQSFNFGIKLRLLLLNFTKPIRFELVYYGIAFTDNFTYTAISGLRVLHIFLQFIKRIMQIMC